MTRNSSNEPICVSYLREILAKSNMTKTQFAESCGRPTSFVYNALSRGYMSKPAAKLLCAVHGADIDKLMPPQEPETPKEVEQARVLMSDDKTLTALVESLNRVEKKLDTISHLLGV